MREEPHHAVSSTAAHPELYLLLVTRMANTRQKQSIEPRPTVASNTLGKCCVCLSCRGHGGVYMAVGSPIFARTERFTVSQAAPKLNVSVPAIVQLFPFGTIDICIAVIQTGSFRDSEITAATSTEIPSSQRRFPVSLGVHVKTQVANIPGRICLPFRKCWSAGAQFNARPDATASPSFAIEKVVARLNSHGNDSTFHPLNVWRRTRNRHFS